ncbi:MAG: hypothetical protein LBP87_03780 [Planctomycetaceae bacterium]|jgi:hypothetical protein|nr:hypothetical protein [Planctomycetaceae bacterium]
MTQLHSISGAPFDVHVPAEIPCPVPDWENGVLRAYSPEERKSIYNWYVECGLAKPLEEILGDARPMTKQDLEEMRRVAEELFPPEENWDDFWNEIDEMKRESFQVQLEKMKRDEI